jgi:hypothetical protein
MITENRINEYGCLMALPPIEYCYKMIDLAKRIIPVNNLYIDSDDSSIVVRMARNCTSICNI